MDEGNGGVMDEDKRAAAWAAVEEVEGGMIVGLGTGSTAAFAILRLGEKVRAGLDVRAVATSLATEAAARAAGIPMVDFADLAQVDLTIDGTDEIDDRMMLIKGAGGAMLREKIVAAASRRMIVIADASKRVAAIGGVAVPVEVLPFAERFAIARLEALGADARPRRVAGVAYRSDQGNLVVDCGFRDMPDPAALAARIQAIPGVLGHGIFLEEADGAYIADRGRVLRLDRARSGA